MQQLNGCRHAAGRPVVRAGHCHPLLPSKTSTVCVKCKAIGSRKTTKRDTGRQGRGFGAERRGNAPAQQLVQDPGADTATSDNATSDSATQSMIPEYQIYTDPDYRPQRCVGPIQLTDVPGHGRGLVTNEGVEAGTLLALSTALATLEGPWKASPPEPEELHMSWLEDGVKPSQRRVLASLYDGTEESMSQSVSLTTLDAKFWASRGNNDTQAPQVSSGKLLNIINNCACADTEQDAAAYAVRHQRPSSYIGLWPEHSFLNHSCLPNTSVVVIGDRMLIHASRELAEGEELTRNYVPHLSTAPVHIRQAGLQEAGYDFSCDCPRCRLEANASDELKDALQAAYAWYTEDAVPRFNQAQQTEDLSTLQELYDEAQELVNELESIVEGDKSLSDPERTVLRAAAYDTYDMLLMCDEFLHQNKPTWQHLLDCLELISAIAPGSESHILVALKYQKTIADNVELTEALAKQGRLTKKQQQDLKTKRLQLDIATEYYLEAWTARYGFITLPTLQALTEGFEVYYDAMEQMAVMEAMGVSESVSEMEINGVKVSVVDRMEKTMADSIQLSQDSPADYTEEVSTKDGVRVLLTQETAANQEPIDVEFENIEVKNEGVADEDIEAAEAAVVASSGQRRKPSKNNRQGRLSKGSSKKR